MGEFEFSGCEELRYCTECYRLYSLESFENPSPIQGHCDHCGNCNWDELSPWDGTADTPEADGYGGAGVGVGVKYDTEKTRYDLIEPGFLEGLAKALTFGAEKHGDTDYRSNPDRNAGTEYAAVMRHIEAKRKGQKADPETGLDPLFHAVARLMTWWSIDWAQRRREIDCNQEAPID